DRPVASDFVVRSEQFGIPQSRHRVIVLGLHKDLAGTLDQSELKLLVPESSRVSVRDVLKAMPKLRSGFSDFDDAPDNWHSQVSDLMQRVSRMTTGLSSEVGKRFRLLGEQIAVGVERASRARSRTGGSYAGVGSACPDDLAEWLVDPRLRRFPNSETRSHMF